MRVLISTTRGAGHFGPLIPFAQAIVRAGSDVLVCVPESGVPMVEGAGFPAWAVAEPDSAERDAVFVAVRQLSEDEANLRVVRDVFARMDAAATHPRLAAAMTAWRPDLVLYETGEFAAPLEAERRGVPAVHVCISSTGVEARFLPMAAEGLVDLRRELGLPADPNGDRLLGATHYSLFPASYEDPAAPRLPGALRFREPAVPSRPLPDWWGGDDRPLLYVTFGSVVPAMPFFPGVYQAALGALASLDVRILCTIGRRREVSELGLLPPNVHVEQWVPGAAVMPHAAAMVHHGGSGTTLQGLVGGVPAAVLPLFADQPYNAARIHAVGAGLALEGGPPAAARLPGAVRELLVDPSYRVAAGLLADEIAALPIIDAAPALLRGLLAA